MVILFCGLQLYYCVLVQSPVLLFVSVSICVGAFGVAVVLQFPSSLIAADYSHLPSIKLITLQYIYPDSPLTHRQTVVATTAVV